jgi:hypothetical protein
MYSGKIAVPPGGGGIRKKYRNMPLCYFKSYYSQCELDDYLYRVSQNWRTNGALRCRRDYRKRQKNV